MEDVTDHVFRRCSPAGTLNFDLSSRVSASGRCGKILRNGGRAGLTTICNLDRASIRRLYASRCPRPAQVCSTSATFRNDILDRSRWQRNLGHLEKVFHIFSRQHHVRPPGRVLSFRMECMSIRASQFRLRRSTASTSARGTATCPGLCHQGRVSGFTKDGHLELCRNAGNSHCTVFSRQQWSWT
jgi:hypothetical protein